MLTYNNRLNQAKDRIDELERIASYFRGKNYFDGDGTQSYSVFQGVYKYFEDVDVSKTIIKFHANSWISKGLSDEKISSVSGFTRPFIEYTNARIKLKFDGSVLREKLSTSLRLIANCYIVYRLSPKTDSFNIVLENCLFGKIKMAKSADTDKYKYQGHGIGFDSTGTFTHPDGGTGKNVIILGVDMTNSKHANNEAKDVLVLGRSLTQKIDDTTIYAEKMYSPNFTFANKTFCMSLHYNGDDSYLFINGKKVIKSNAKKQRVVEKLSLGNISADFNQAATKLTGLYVYIYDFSVGYNPISNNKIHDIHAYLMKKNDIIQMFEFIKKCFFTAMTSFNFNLPNVNSLECASMNNQECKIRPEIINLNTNEPLLYPYNIKISRCKGTCNTSNDPYAKICFSDKIKNTNVKVFNLMSRTNATTHIKWHKTCKCRCRLDASVTINKDGTNTDADVNVKN